MEKVLTRREREKLETRQALPQSALTLFRALFSFLQGFLAAKVAQNVAHDLRNALWQVQA